MKFFNIIIALSIGLSVLSCSNKDPYDTAIPPRQIKFNTTALNFQIENEAVEQMIEIGATAKNNTDENFSIELQKNSNNAIAGTHFLLEQQNGVMKANEVISKLKFTALASDEYQSGRIDTLIYRITDSKGAVADLGTELRIIIKKK